MRFPLEAPPHLLKPAVQIGLESQRKNISKKVSCTNLYLDTLLLQLVNVHSHYILTALSLSGYGQLWDGINSCLGMVFRKNALGEVSVPK